MLRHAMMYELFDVFLYHGLISERYEASDRMGLRTRRMKSKNSRHVELTRLSRFDSRVVSARIDWKTSCLIRCLKMFPFLSRRHVRKKRNAAADRGMRQRGTIDQKQLNVPRRRCLSFERRRVATRGPILDERTKKWLRKECCCVKFESRSHSHRNRLVFSRDSVNVGSMKRMSSGDSQGRSNSRNAPGTSLASGTS